MQVTKKRKTIGMEKYDHPCRRGRRGKKEKGQYLLGWTPQLSNEEKPGTGTGKDRGGDLLINIRRKQPKKRNSPE